MNTNDKINELPTEAQFHLAKTERALSKMSREQLEAYTKTVLVHHLWSEQNYKQMLKTKWGISNE